MRLHWEGRRQGLRCHMIEAACNGIQRAYRHGIACKTDSEEMNSGHRKFGPKTARTERGTFGRGNPGKPKGARHRTTLAVEALLDGEAEGLTRKAIKMALAGDTVALRLCMDRIAPARKDRPVVLKCLSCRRLRMRQKGL